MVFVQGKKVHLGRILSAGLSAQVVSVHRSILQISGLEESKVFFVDTWSFSEVVFNTDWTVYKSGV